MQKKEVVAKNQFLIIIIYNFYKKNFIIFIKAFCKMIFNFNSIDYLNNS